MEEKKSKRKFKSLSSASRKELINVHLEAIKGWKGLERKGREIGWWKRNKKVFRKVVFCLLPPHLPPPQQRGRKWMSSSSSSSTSKTAQRHGPRENRLDRAQKFFFFLWPISFQRPPRNYTFMYNYAFYVQMYFSCFVHPLRGKISQVVHSVDASSSDCPDIKSA